MPYSKEKQAAYMKGRRQGKASAADTKLSVNPVQPVNPPSVNPVNPQNPPPEAPEVSPPPEASKTPPAEKSKGEGTKSPVKKIPTTTVQPGQVVKVLPREFTMTSTLLWQAREAAIREWGWPANISLEDFVDTWLYLSFKANGIVLGGYMKVEKDGHKTYTEEEVGEAVRVAIAQLTGKEADDAS